MGLKLIYEGKSKLVYDVGGDELILEFKDDVTAMDGLYKSSVVGKGVLNARVSTYLFELVERAGVRTHYLSYDGGRRLLVRKLSMVPLEVIVRNYAYGSLLKRMPLYKQLQKLEPPIIEFHYKDDSLHDPLIIAEDALAVGLLTKEELNHIVKTTLKINEVLSNVFKERGLKLVDMKVEFGRAKDGELLLADEITGDSFRVLDGNGDHLDKEVFRKTKDVNLMIKAYVKLCKALGLDVSDVVSG